MEHYALSTSSQDMIRRLSMIPPLLARFVAGRSIARISACVLSLSASISSVDAALLIYEGFDGYNTTTNGFVSQSPNSNSIGLGTDTYAQGSATGLPLTVNATGLTFSNLTVHGGKLNITSGSTSVASAKLADSTSL